MKQPLTIAIFLAVSISSHAQDGYIGTPFLGKTPIFTGGYVMPPQLLVNKQEEKIVSTNKAEKIGRILNKNNAWIPALTEKIYIFKEDGSYLGFFTFNHGDKSIITIYDESGSFLTYGAADNKDIALINSLIGVDVAE